MIGLFIGSFNPPTMAHLEICLKLKNNFSKIVLVPVNSNDKRLIDIKKRIAMLNILKSKYPFLEISNIMQNYSYLNYRIIDLLNEKYGSFSIIMGSDLLEKFDLFDHYEYLLSKYHFTIIPRANIDSNKIICSKYSKFYDKFTILDYQSIISSTLVRNNLKENKSVEGLLDKSILKYIKDNDLY